MTLVFAIIAMTVTGELLFPGNRAAALARGKYVMIMDDDDKSLPTRMGAQVSFLESHPEIAAVAGQTKGLTRIPAKS